MLEVCARNILSDSEDVIQIYDDNDINQSSAKIHSINL